MRGIEIVVYGAKEWALVSEEAHRIAFGTIKPASMDRIDFALLAVKDDVSMGYVTCRETDAKTLYWQHGGAFPGTKDSIHTWPAYSLFMEHCQGMGYDRVTTVIENTNAVMLKMAQKVGFKIIGVRNFNGAVLLEHVKEFK